MASQNSIAGKQAAGAVAGEEVAVAAAEDEVSVEEEFGSLKPLRDSGLGEWVALGAPAKGEGLTSKPSGRKSLPLS